MRAAAHTVTASDAEAVELLLSLDYLTRLHPVGERCGLSISATEIGPLSLGRASFDMVGDLRGRSQGVIGIGRARAGRLAYTYGTEELRWGRGDVFIAVDPASEYVLHVENADVEHTMIDVGTFQHMAEPPPGQDLWFNGHAPVSARAATTWVRTWQLVSDITADSSRAVPDLLVGQMSRMLAAVTLATFPNNALHEIEAQDRRDAHPAAVRRAISLVEANPDLDLSVADMARAAHVSTRALQLAFRRSLDSTPMAYLRRVRLDRAHAELLAAVPGDGTTVTGVAARWGWARPSRFAASYRAAYGRHPSDDLARTSSFGGR